MKPKVENVFFSCEVSCDVTKDRVHLFALPFFFIYSFILKIKVRKLFVIWYLKLFFQLNEFN